MKGDEILVMATKFESGSVLGGLATSFLSDGPKPDVSFLHHRGLVGFKLLGKSPL